MIIAEISPPLQKSLNLEDMFCIFTVAEGSNGGLEMSKLFSNLFRVIQIGHSSLEMPDCNLRHFYLIQRSKNHICLLGD